MSQINCKNCDQSFIGNFCPNCGQSAKEQRIDLHYFVHDVPHSVFHIDAGFFFTLKMLFTRPGVMVKSYIDGKRAKHFRPFAYVMIMTAISALLVNLLDWGKEMLIQNNSPAHLAAESHNFFEHYFSVFVFLMIPFASLVTWLVFIRRPYNFWEHFLANTYISAQLNVIWVLIHLVGFLSALFASNDYSVTKLVFYICFMTTFLYMYGSVFGFLMNDYYKRWKLILILTGMNLILYFVYSIGFHVAGLWQITNLTI